jgi:nitrous oxidase accessory protein NosD
MKRTAVSVSLVGIVFVLAGGGADPADALRAAPDAAAAVPRQVLVVDDGQDCPRADFASIQAAVSAAEPGALVRVCPGVYWERVQIDKPLTLLGVPDLIEVVDCFDSSATAGEDLDPVRYPILQRPPGEPGSLVTVESGDVTVAGLVLEGATTDNPPDLIYDAAVHLLSGSAGARIHHNLIRDNSLGIDLGSDGSAMTRVDHNCLRDNAWGMASQRQEFHRGKVDHNHTFQHTVFAYEVGWFRNATQESSFTDNVARQDATTFFVENTDSVTIANNDIRPVSRGVVSYGGNLDLVISGNRIAGGAGLGVLFQPPRTDTGLLPSRGVTVSGNDISGFSNPSSGGIGIGVAFGPVGTVHDVLVAENVVHDNAVAGVSVQRNNTGVVVRGNLASGNPVGIWSRPLAAGMRYEQNVLLGNVVDARDDNRPANVWVGNVCAVDVPQGTICGVG